MNKKFLLSTIASAITMVIPNAIISATFYYDFLKAHSGLSNDVWDKFQRSAGQTETAAAIITLLFIGIFISSVVYFTKAKTFWDGMKWAFFFGVLLAGTTNFGFIATTHYWSYFSAIIDIFVAATTFALGGGVAALILGREKQAD